MIRNTFLLAVLFFISSCGYHLRGNTDLSEGLNSLYLHGGSSELRNTLKKTLKSSKGKLVTSITDADIVVQVIKEKMDRRVLSLSSTGKVTEFELVFSLHYLLVDNEGNKKTDEQKIEINRDYFNDQGDVLGRNNEEKIIRKEIYRQVVKSIIRRTRFVLANDSKS